MLDLWGPFVRLSLLVVLFTGCGGRSVSTDTKTDELEHCDRLCGEVRACNGFSDECVNDCGELVTDADAAGCAGALDAFLGCAESAPDVCNPSRSCERSANAYAACITDFCYVNQASKACSGSF